MVSAGALVSIPAVPNAVAADETQLTIGLADTLRNEMHMFGIKVHLYMPAGMLSPGYEEENRVKPKIAQKIEEGDKPISCDAAAAILIKGIERGHYQITNDFVTDLVRVSAKGAVPGNGLLDVFYGIVGAVSHLG